MGEKFLDEERERSENRKTRINDSFQKCVPSLPNPTLLPSSVATLSLMKARKGICLTTSSSTETKFLFQLFLERHSTLFPFYLIWSLSCMDQSFPENFEIVDKTLMFLRKSFRYGKQKMNYFLLKKLESCFLRLHLDFRENRMEICRDLFRL